MNYEALFYTIAIFVVLSISGLWMNYRRMSYEKLSGQKISYIDYVVNCDHLIINQDKQQTTK